MIFGWLSSSRTPRGDHFVEEVEERIQWRRVDALVVVGWSLILLKCVLASIAIRHWNMPIADFYIWVPSFVFGGLCTFLHLTRKTD